MEDVMTGSSSGALARHPLGLWDQTKKPIVLAAVALAVGVITSRRRARSGVFGTVLKGALFGALSAIPQIVLLRLSKKFLGHEGSTQSAAPSVAVAPTSPE
jgi:hypothetical protein